MLKIVQPVSIPGPECLTVSAKEAARMIGISERTLFTLTKEGKIDSLRIGRKVLYSAEKIRAFVNGEADRR